MWDLLLDKRRPMTAPVRPATKMDKSQSENPATEFAAFVNKVIHKVKDRAEPLNENHEGTI